MTTEYLEKLKAEMEGRLGCGIEVVEDFTQANTGF